MSLHVVSLFFEAHFHLQWNIKLPLFANETIKMGLSSWLASHEGSFQKEKKKKIKKVL